MRSAFRSAAVPSLRSVPKSQVLPAEGAALASGGSTKLVQAGLGGLGRIPGPGAWSAAELCGSG